MREIGDKAIFRRVGVVVGGRRGRGRQVRDRPSNIQGVRISINMGVSTANAALVLVVCNENRGGSERKGPRDQRRIFVRYAAAMPSQSRGDRDVKITVGMSDSARVEWSGVPSSALHDVSATFCFLDGLRPPFLVNTQ